MLRERERAGKRFRLNEILIKHICGSSGKIAIIAFVVVIVFNHNLD